MLRDPIRQWLLRRAVRLAQFLDAFDAPAIAVPIYRLAAARGSMEAHYHLAMAHYLARGAVLDADMVRHHLEISKDAYPPSNKLYEEIRSATASQQTLESARAGGKKVAAIIKQATGLEIRTNPWRLTYFVAAFALPVVAFFAYEAKPIEALLLMGLSVLCWWLAMKP